MSKFIFQLEALLRHRSHIEHQRQRELAAVLGKIARLEGELKSMDDTLQTSLQDLRDNRLVGRLDLHFLAAHRRYILATQRKVHAIAQEMAQVRLEVDAARSALGEAARQRKMLEKLREKHKERWSADQARREFAELDDIGMRLAFNQALEDSAPAGADPGDGSENAL